MSVSEQIKRIASAGSALRALPRPNEPLNDYDFDAVFDAALEASELDPDAQINVETCLRLINTIAVPPHDYVSSGKDLLSFASAALVLRDHLHQLSSSLNQTAAFDAGIEIDRSRYDTELRRMTEILNEISEKTDRIDREMASISDANKPSQGPIDSITIEPTGAVTFKPNWKFLKKLADDARTMIDGKDIYSGKLASSLSILATAAQGAWSWIKARARYFAETIINMTREVVTRSLEALKTGASITHSSIQHFKMLPSLQTREGVKNWAAQTWGHRTQRYETTESPFRVVVAPP